MLKKFSIILRFPFLYTTMLLATLAFSMVLSQAVLAAGTWSTTGSLNTARAVHTATLLTGGKVLVAGGTGNGGPSGYVALNSAELYDSSTGAWSLTGYLKTGRNTHTATLLPNGNVLVAGGCDGYQWLNSAELFNPTTGKWSTTGPLAAGRHFHTATLLPNGQVLAAGGVGLVGGYSDDLSSAELYNPSTGKWKAATSMKAPRTFHTATLLANGKVLVTGGDNSTNGILSSAELYDPATGAWSFTGSMSTGRWSHTATKLTNGKVLVAGGGSSGYSAELYDPATGTWSPTGRMNVEHSDHTATLLYNGKVLVAGGIYGGNCNAELYDPGTGVWTPTNSMNTDRGQHTATLLTNGNVLVAGGGNILSSAELYPSAGPISYTITASAGAGGAIAPSGTVSLKYGANQTFNITPNKGYQVAYVLVDGVSIGAQSSYTFVNITANHAIAANFNLIPVPPVVNFVAVPSSGTAPLKVQFNDLSKGSIDTRAWDFGDSSASAEQNPSHTYNTPGSYKVKLTVTGPGGSKSKTATVTVKKPPAPKVVFTATPLSGKAPLTVQFTNTSTGNINAQAWDFGDGGASTDKSPSHTYNNPGTYKAKLTATGPGGSASKTVSIKVTKP